MADNAFYYVTGFMLTVFAVTTLTVYLIATDYQENYGFLNDAVEFKEETVNGQYCITYVTANIDERFDGKQMIIEKKLTEREKCVDPSTDYAEELHDRVKAKIVELRVISNDPILKKLKEHQLK